MKRFLIFVSLIFLGIQSAFCIAPVRNLTGNNSLIVITEDSVKSQTDTINRIYDSINIYIPDDFDFENVSNSDFNVNFIESLHNAYSQGIQVKIEGPLEYIYASGVLSKNLFIEIKEKINAAKGKHICIDLSDCYFINLSAQNILLPKNCFANEKDLYWIYLGDMLESSIAENFCNNCSNLKTVFMWNEKDFLFGAFENINPSAIIVNEKQNFQSLKSYKEKYLLEDLSDWDYTDIDKSNELIPIEENITDSENEISVEEENIESTETTEEIFEDNEIPENTEIPEDNEIVIVGSGIISNQSSKDNLNDKNQNEDSSKTRKTEFKEADTGVVWLIDRWGHFQPQKPLRKVDDFGLYDYINSEDFVPVAKNELANLPKLEDLFDGNLENPDFELLDKVIYIDEDLAKIYESDNPRSFDPYEIAQTFLSSYILKTEKYNNYMDFSSDVASNVEIFLDSNKSYSLRKYKNLRIYIIKSFDYSAANASLLFCVEGDINDEHVKNVSLLKMKRYDNMWAVLNIYNGWLDYYQANIDFNK